MSETRWPTIIKLEVHIHESIFNVKSLKMEDRTILHLLNRRKYDNNQIFYGKYV